MTMKKTACIALAAALAAALAPYDMAAAPTRRAASRPAASPAAKSTAAKPAAAKPAATPVQTRYRKSPYVGALSLDAVSGRTLFADNADVEAYPASITKLMTAFIVLDEVSAGRLKLTDQVTASPTRSRLDVHLRQPSCIGLKAGESMSVDDLLRVMLVHSANDAAVFLAEKCSGSVDAFVHRMNAKAKSLGMTSTKFYNPNGLPPPRNAKERNFNVSTCKDLALLARAILAEHSNILRYTSIKTYEATLPNGNKQRFVNHNNVMVKDRLKVRNPDGSEAADGLKTGYIDAGGSSVVLTGKRGGKRAIVVVLGSTSAAERDAKAAALLEDALDTLSL